MGRLAIVVPCYNEEEALETTNEKLVRVLKYLIDKNKADYESNHETLGCV